MALIHSPALTLGNLIAYYDASNIKSYPGSGTTWYDLSGNNANMTLSNIGSYTSGTTSYFTFNGTNSIGSASINNFNGTSTTSGTIEGWVNIIGTTGYRYIMGFRGNTNFNYYFLLLNSSTTTEARITTATIATADINYVPSGGWNQWQQIVFTFNRTDNLSRLYINGRLVQTYGSAITGAFGTAANFEVGNSTSTPFPTNMYASKFLVYSKALSASEISNNYNAFKGQFGLL